jgi:hypothetical protein
MLVEFDRQLESYQRGFVSPVEMALSSNPTDALASVARPKWNRLAENEWDREDGPALVGHIHPGHQFVVDEVNRVRRKLDRPLGQIKDREGSMEVCAQLYDGIRRFPIAYEFEQVSGTLGAQGIRTPRQIMTHNTATCIDLVCLFASLLEGAWQNPLLVVLEGPEFAHALVGYRVHGEPHWEDPGIGGLRGALALRDAVLFEATGCVMADGPVGAERPDERRDKFLDFMDAVAAAERMMARGDVRLKHFLDVRITRLRGLEQQG